MGSSPASPPSAGSSSSSAPPSQITGALFTASIERISASRAAVMGTALGRTRAIPGIGPEPEGAAEDPVVAMEVCEGTGEEAEGAVSVTGLFLYR